MGVYSDSANFEPARHLQVLKCDQVPLVLLKYELIGGYLIYDQRPRD